MNETQLFELAQREKNLLYHGSYAFERQRTELVLLEKVVQVLLEHLKDETRVRLVLKDFVGAHKIVLVGVFLAQTRQYTHLDLALTRVRRMILEDLDGHNLVSTLVPAFDYLAERATAQKLEHFVAVRHRIEYLVQNQLVVALIRSTRAIKQKAIK